MKSVRTDMTWGLSYQKICKHKAYFTNYTSITIVLEISLCSYSNEPIATKFCTCNALLRVQKFVVVSYSQECSYSEINVSQNLTFDGIDVKKWVSGTHFINDFPLQFKSYEGIPTKLYKLPKSIVKWRPRNDLYQNEFVNVFELWVKNAVSEIGHSLEFYFLRHE